MYGGYEQVVQSDMHYYHLSARLSDPPSLLFVN